MRKLEREERGFTLVELLVATALSLVLIGVAVALITSALQSEPRTSSRSSQIEAGRVMLERITRELREGCRVEGGGQALSVYMDCEADDPTYRYSCDSGDADPDHASCSREDVAAGTSVLMVDGLEDDPDEVWPVFTVDSNNYVEIQLRFPREEADGESVTLSDGVAMRNEPPETS